ncbi:MAG TPA: hypothetical protein PKZ19_02700 [Zoogloea sp.]|nr:hypothetical protein [Zoogloea sp.]
MKIDSPRIASFQPPVRTLMGPGPSDVPPRVLAAMPVPPSVTWIRLSWA